MVPPEFNPIAMNLVESHDHTDLDGRNTSRHQWLNRLKTEDRAKGLCESFLEQMGASQNAFEKLRIFDAHFSVLLATSFEVKESSDIIARRTCHLLERLPATAAPLPVSSLTDSSRHSSNERTLSPPLSKEDVIAGAEYFDSNTIRFALHLVLIRSDPTSWGGIYRKLVDLCGELLAGALAISSVQESTVDRVSTSTANLGFLKLLLWSAWQRCIMLYLWYAMGQHIEKGFHDRMGIFAFSNMPLLKRLMADSVAANTTTASTTTMRLAPYMCQWAFRLLKDDEGSVSQDFRQFYRRYNDMFGDLDPRCKFSDDRPGLTQQCIGDSPFTCNRFIGMKISDQSAHAPTCKTNCAKLYWDASSYRMVNGPRAVDIQRTQAEVITYRQATNTTMAISHVWSHGQGGRPEPSEENGTGFNRCLHERYQRAAALLGCDTYWMDTPCIPQDHNLRREAIGHINGIFANAKVTLVCDRDIMKIDVEPQNRGGNADTRGKIIQASNVPIAIQESLMATVLVCDWNLRAWTFLEAMRGGRALCLLCENDNLVMLSEIISNVYHYGRIDVSTLYVNALHLLPALKTDMYTVVANRQAREAGMSESVDLLQATYLLSHRHASRPGDEVVIWSLLCGKNPYFNAIDLWSVHMNGSVPTEFLMNNLPRIRQTLFKRHKKNLGWAPSRPNFPDDWDINKRPRYYPHAYHSLCDLGQILESGLYGRWLFWDFNCRWICRSMGSKADPLERFLYSIVDKHLRYYRWGAIIRPCNMAIEPLLNRGTAEGTAIAIIGTYTGNRFHWRGLVDWPSSLPLPYMWDERILIV